MNFYNKFLKQEAASQYQEWTCSVLRQWSARTLNLWCKGFAFAKLCDDFYVLSMTAQVLVLHVVQQQTTQVHFLFSGWQGQGLMQALLRSLPPNCSVTEVQWEWTQQVTKERHSLLGKWKHLTEKLAHLSVPALSEINKLCVIYEPGYWNKQLFHLIKIWPSHKLQFMQWLHQTLLIANTPKLRDWQN